MFEYGIRTPDGDITFVKPGEGAVPVVGRTPENEGTGDRTEPRAAATPVSPSKTRVLLSWACGKTLESLDALRRR